MLSSKSAAIARISVVQIVRRGRGWLGTGDRLPVPSTRHRRPRPDYFPSSNNDAPFLGGLLGFFWKNAQVQMLTRPVRTFFWPCAFTLLRTTSGWQEGEVLLHHGGGASFLVRARSVFVLECFRRIRLAALDRWLLSQFHA